jgi:hypothetical protein
MGCTALMLSDMPNVDRNVKIILTLLICFAASMGEGGSAVVVWTLIFGSRTDSITKTKLFYAVGLTLVVINLIYTFMAGFGNWTGIIISLGFLLAAPFLSKYNSFNADVSKSHRRIRQSRKKHGHGNAGRDLFGGGARPCRVLRRSPLQKGTFSVGGKGRRLYF